jgi:hypothetical protein
VIKIIAVCAQSIFLIVSRVSRNSFIGVDGLDMGANDVLFRHHRRGGTGGRVGSRIVGSRVVCGRVVCGRVVCGCVVCGHLGGCKATSEDSVSSRAAGGSGLGRLLNKKGRESSVGEGKINCMYTNWAT